MDGLKIHYIESGKGAAILFVPGWTTPAWIWEKQIARFAPTHRVVAMDPRSQGESSQTPEGLYPAARARDIKAVVDQLKLAPAILVGWSMGAAELAAYVNQFGTDTVAGLVFVDVALRGARESGTEATLIDLRNYQLISCDGKENESGYPKDVFRLRDDVKRAHGLILGTPEYHGGVSGVLKNALDLLGFDELEGKMIALVGVSGGALGAVHALSHLHTVGRVLHAWVIPEQVAISEAWKVFDEEGNLKNPK